MKSVTTKRQSFEDWAKVSFPYLPLDWDIDKVWYSDPRTEVAFYAYEEGMRYAKRDIPETAFATEEEGDAYTHGWFEGLEEGKKNGR